MRLLASCLLLALAAMPAAAEAPALAPGRTLEGDWQAVIASPKRPWIFEMRFEPAGTHWIGNMSIEGLADFPLQDIRLESTRVHFRFPPELDSMVFEGTLGSAEIVGQVTMQEGPTPTRLTRDAPLPTPANRVEAWRQDLDFAAARLSEYDRSFRPRSRDRFRQALAALKQSLANKSDAQILVALSRAVALAGNAHTRLRLQRARQSLLPTELPIRMWWFSDGLYVVKAAPRYRRAVRCRVVAINDHDLSEVRGQVANLFAGNASWHAYLTPIYLTSPDVLHGLGLMRSMKGTTITFENAKRTRFKLWVSAEPIDRSQRVAESWQELSSLLPGKARWPTALSPDPDRVPLYLRHVDEAYWFDYRSDSGLLYFQFNRSDNAEQEPTFQAFGDSLLTFVERHPVRDVVVDLRFNSGGNLDVAKAFMKGLAQVEKINRPGHLFVITGHCTFSAGLYHAAQLKQFTHATFVGEPVGDELDFWAEGGRIVLPNTHVSINYSNGFHRYSGRDYPGYPPYYEALSVPTLAPDVPVPMSSRDYFSGRDPALDAIAARLRQ